MLPAEGAQHFDKHAEATQSFNGAAGCYPRKAPKPRKAAQPRYGLQWGRGLLPAEGERHPSKPSEHVGASMGPRVVTRGRNAVVCALAVRQRASMGPRVVTRGRLMILRNTVVSGAASMGPRVVTRGRLDLRAYAIGAPTVLQWGRGLLPAEGPTIDVDCESASRFNGAAGCYPRKDRQSQTFRSSHGDASMGPRVVTRGRMQQRQHSTPAILTASMGPRVVTRGRFRWLDRVHPPVVLQWGRGLLPAEGSRFSISVVMLFSLQWGRGLLPAEGTMGA